MKRLHWLAFLVPLLLGSVVFFSAYSQQPILYGPWEGIAQISQGNFGDFSHDDCHHREFNPENCKWENKYAIDIALPIGSPVLAPADGIVTWIKESVSGYGRGLAISVTGPTGEKFEIVFLHLSKICVSPQQRVFRGQVIALSGASGKGSENGFSPHLHFHIWSGQGDRASHTQPIERLLLRKVGADKGFVFYSSPRNRTDLGAHTLHDKIVRGELFESSNTRKQDFCSSGHGLPVTFSSTATVLVMDVSGSMGESWRGGVKIESAKKAALQFIEEVANEPRPPGYEHQIGVVTFSTSARLALPLTSDYSEAKNVIIQLHPTNFTNLGAGLVEALKELEKVPSAKRFVILLSDGMTNTGMSRAQILSGPVAEARRKGRSIDEKFLRDIAQQSGCGSYNYAASGFELFGTYVKIRHRMLGSNRIVEFTSKTPKGSRVYVLPGQSVALGAFQLTSPAKELHYTLTWAENGRLVAELVDPTGRRVTASYPGAQIYSGNGFSHITVFSPRKGIWKAVARVISTFPKGVQYYGVVSARTGGFVIPYEVPEICIFDDVCIPLPDLPTWLLVGISLVALAIVLYQQTLGGM